MTDQDLQEIEALIEQAIKDLDYNLDVPPLTQVNRIVWEANTKASLACSKLRDKLPHLVQTLKRYRDALQEIGYYCNAQYHDKTQCEICERTAREALEGKE